MAKNQIPGMKQVDPDELLIKERDFLSAILETTGALVVVFDAQGRFLRINQAFEKLTGFSIMDIVGQTFWEAMLPKEEGVKIEKLFGQIAPGKYPKEYQTRIKSKTGRWRTIVWSFTALPREKSVENFIVASGIDITKIIQLEKERERIIKDLKQALGKVRTLSGLLPICSNCKKIRDDKGYWNQIEEYIKKYSEAEFSHGLCPDCAQALYADYYGSESKNKSPKGGNGPKK